MEINLGATINKAIEVFNKINASFNDNQKKQYKEYIDLISKNLSTIEAVENKTIANISWGHYINLIADAKEALWNMWEKFDKQFLDANYASLYELDKLLSAILCDKCDLKLAQLNQYYNKLAADVKKNVDDLAKHIKLIKCVLFDFVGFCNEVTVTDPKNLNDANIHKEAILSALTDAIWGCENDEIAIYEEEGFLVDDCDEKKKKPN